MSDDFKENIQSKSIWIRGLFMLLFTLFWGVAEIVLAAVAVFQFGCVLFTGKPNDNATQLGNSIGQYIFQIAQFVTFNSEERPFPFTPWPEPKRNKTKA
jgi:hypothetical protein